MGDMVMRIVGLHFNDNIGENGGARNENESEPKDGRRVHEHVHAHEYGCHRNGRPNVATHVCECDMFLIKQNS